MVAVLLADKMTRHWHIFYPFANIRPLILQIVSFIHWVDTFLERAISMQ